MVSGQLNDGMIVKSESDKKHKNVMKAMSSINPDDGVKLLESDNMNKIQEGTSESKKFGVLEVLNEKKGKNELKKGGVLKAAGALEIKTQR